MSTVQYYLPRLSHFDVQMVCRFSAAQMVRADERGETSVLFDWLAAAMLSEQARRDSLDDDEPADVEMLRLPNWTAAEVAEAVVTANNIALLSWSRPVGQLIDAIALAVNCRAAYLLRTAL